MKNIEMRNRIVEHFGTQRVFAYHLNITGSYVSQILNGHVTPPLHIRKRMCDLLKARESTLFKLKR